MSLSNILTNNNLNLYCASITANTQNIGSTTSNITTGPALLINQTGTLQDNVIDVNVTDNTSNKRLMLFNSSQPDSEIQLSNNNPSSVSNGIVCYDNNNNKVLSVGNDNADSTSYVYTYGSIPLKIGTNNTERYRITQNGSILSNITPNISFSNYTLQYFSGTTSGISSTVLFTSSTVPNTMISVEVRAHAYGTTSIALGYIQTTLLFSNISGAVSYIGVLSGSTFSFTGTTPGISIIGAVSASLIEIIAVGSSGLNLSWTGYCNVSY